ncbi:MAG TPA: hypothetical protein VJH94_00740 [Candidatus Paceibacterota bacterium]
MEGVKIDDAVIIFKIPKVYRPDLTDAGILEVTSRAWKLGKRREKAQYAFAVHQAKVVGVYSIIQWHEDEQEPKRWAFDGKPAPNHIRNKYLDHTVVKYTKGTYGPILYVNC